MYIYIFNISIFPGTKVTCYTEFYHYFCSDVLCVWSCIVSKTEISWCIKIVCRFQLPTKDVGLLSFFCWECGFESRRRHGFSCVPCVVCSQVEVSASGWSLVQSSPTECGVSECDREASLMRRPWPARGLLCHKKN